MKPGFGLSDSLKTGKIEIPNGGRSGVLSLTAASIDTYIRANAPTTNFGTNVQLQIGDLVSDPGRVLRTLIKFDLSSIPAGATIVSAVLSLFCVADFSDNARTFRVFRLKRAWMETEATWNIYSTGNNWQTAGGFGTDDCEQTDIGSRAFTATETINEYKDFILTPITKEALDLGNGWLIKADTETQDAYLFSSSDAPSNKPKLIVSWSTP